MDPEMTVSLSAGFGTLYIIVDPVADASYQFRLIQTDPAAPDRVWIDASRVQTVYVSEPATYQVGVTTGGDEVLSAPVTLAALTLADLIRSQN